MNNRESRFLEFDSTATALLVTVLLASGGASAKDRKAKGSENQARVVAHISFTGLSAIDMAVQNKGNDKVYLYVQHSQSQGISIIDISKPAEPKALGVISWPDPAMSSRMNVTDYGWFRGRRIANRNKQSPRTTTEGKACFAAQSRQAERRPSYISAQISDGVR